MINSIIPAILTQPVSNRTHSAPKNHPLNLRDELARHAEQAESARQTAEIQGRHSRDMQKAMEIAARILNGDNVPQSDKDFLLETSPGMFKLAMSARRLDNNDPNDYDALARDRDGSSPAAQLFGEDMARLLSTSAGGVVSSGSVDLMY